MQRGCRFGRKRGAGKRRRVRDPPRRGLGPAHELLLPCSAAAIGQRSLDKLNRQEGEAEKYRAEAQKLQDQEHARRKALDDFLAAFSAE